MQIQTITIVLVLLWTNVRGFKILGLFPHPGKSHFDSFEPLLKGLATKGHEVTLISHFPLKAPFPNWKDIDIGGTIETGHMISLDDFSGARYQKYLTPLLLAYFGYKSCSEGLANENLQNFLKTEQKFDVIITEYFNSQCFFGIIHKVQAPVVGLSSCTVMPWHDSSFGFSNHPAYVPNSFMPFSTEMTFLERVENTVLYLFHHAVAKLLIDIPNEWVARKYLGDDFPPLSDIGANASLILVNTHFTYTQARPTVPGYIEVAGMHLGKSKKLPQNIEKWINESTHGVIYFSLGSMIKGHTFPEEKRQMFLKAFARLPQRVLWKWETEMPGKPDNVMIQKWMPQFDILSHPNVKAFIAHGGLLGTTEAVHCGVPMVIMPQFGDQFTNAKAVEASGGGVILDFHSLDEESIYNALKKVLDPSFNKKAKELSARFRDRPLPPLDTAIYWVEYVARHGGAPHMRTAAVGMPFYKYLLLDVVAFLAAVLFLTVYISYRLTKAVFRKIFKASPTTKKVKKS